MTTYSIFSGSGPSSGTAYASGDLVSGVAFQVTQGGLWLYGYRQWVLPSVQALNVYKYALWQIIGVDAAGPADLNTTTPGTLTAGQWNVTNLATPMLLVPGYTTDAIATTYGCAYHACVGNPSGAWGAFPETKSIFGTGDSDSGGIVAGPITAFSSVSGTLPVGGTSEWLPQMAFTTSIADPSTGMPTQNDTDANLWMDIFLSTIAPAGASFRLFPNGELFNAPGVGPQTGNYTLGTSFTLSESCALNEIWHYSASGCTSLPAEAVIWNTTTQTQVAGTLQTSPTWSGAAGSGWISTPYTGVTLPAGNYAASTYGTGEWFLAQTGWWGTGAAFPSGINHGPIQFTGSQYNLGLGLTYPGTITNEPTGSGEFDGVDVQVTPVAAPSSSLAVNQGSNVILSGTPARMGYGRVPIL